VRLYREDELVNAVPKEGISELDRSCRRGHRDGLPQLVKAGQAGERAAIDRLVRLYQQRAMQAAVGILGDANEAAEAVQAGFLKAYLNIDKLKEPSQFETWLLRIVANAAISQARAAGRRAKNLRPTDCIAIRDTPSPVDRQSTEELKEAIAWALGKLSKKEAAAISLFGLEDLSHKQVARIMGCSVEAARWYVFSARKKLKVLLKDFL
jgi:RNA polymerase sigma-70 factor (ECF subfamily)